MDKKLWVGGGAAVLLSLGTLIGGVTTGMVGAQSPPAAPAAPSQRPNQGTGAEGPDTPVSLPAGSVSQDAAKQAAVAYVQQTAPYNTQGLSTTKVTTDDENGAAVYKVEFSGSNNQAAEVTVSPQGTVLKAEADNGHEQADTDAETADDGPSGTTGAVGNTDPNPNAPVGSGTPPR